MHWSSINAQKNILKFNFSSQILYRETFLRQLNFLKKHIKTYKLKKKLVNFAS